MQMTTKKKPYEKPSMQVFELKQQPQILAGSDNPAPNGGDFDPYLPGGFGW